jgi:hypothetical protein
MSGATEAAHQLASGGDRGCRSSYGGATPSTRYGPVPGWCRDHRLADRFYGERGGRRRDP